ncbi:MAG: acetolactate synthase [Deltaproteobacteria bacterium]|jgi:acetolactate synthase-1/2/3 large subunit|nr:acetolactate synthase [Deltaproteobacteria bacterium]MBW2532077.1 acetolactate synthase [Deltaproteobacteria bacterium]
MGQVHGGRLVAKALVRHGIDHVFTLCGGHIQAIYDGCLDEGIRVVDVRHEQTAGHAADGYARVTGRPGVCLVTAGPGVTDVVTALANAQRAGVPMVCIGGAGPKALCDMGSLQDMDALSLVSPVTKWAVQVPETGRIQEYVDAAFRVARADVPGPVFLEMPLDLLMSFGDDASPATEPLEPPPRPAGDPSSIARAAELLARAERPMFIVGSQIRWSERREVLRSVADRVQVPFYLNGMARGGLPQDHPGLFTRTRRKALAESDLVFVFGTPFDFRLGYGRADTFHPQAEVVQVDLSGRELGRNRRVDVAIHGDSGLVLEQLLQAIEPRGAGDWLGHMRELEDQSRAKMSAEIACDDDPPNPLRVCHELGRRLGPSDVVIGDGGDFVATAAYVLPLEWPQLWMDPGPLGTLGVGPGYAMAAAITRPEARTVLVYGDGSFGFHALEFEAMARQGLAVVALIGNDAAWTQIRRGQVAMYGEARAVATSLEHTRYERVVEAVGGKGYFVDSVAALGPALDQAFAAGVPACVNVTIGQSGFRKNAISV